MPPVWTPLPAAYGCPSFAYGQVGVDALKVGVSTVTTGAGVATSLIAAAGGAALVPGAGWIAGGALALAAGTVSLVSAVAGGRKRKQEAIAAAAQLGFPDPEAVPGYLVRVLRWDENKLQKNLAKVQRQLRAKQQHQQRRGVGKVLSAITRPATAARSMKRLHAKRLLLLAVIQFKKTGGVVAPSVGAGAEPVVPSSVSPSGYGQYTGVIVVGGILLGIGVAFALTRPTRSASEYR